MEIIHSSNCAAHFEPAYPNGECDCGAEAKARGIESYKVVSCGCCKCPCLGCPRFRRDPMYVPYPVYPPYPIYPTYPPYTYPWIWSGTTTITYQTSSESRW